MCLGPFEVGLSTFCALGDRNEWKHPPTAQELKCQQLRLAQALWSLE